LRRHGNQENSFYFKLVILTQKYANQALERVPADIRKQGGVARMSDPKMIKEIIEAVTIPVRLFSYQGFDFPR
jgi:hypothetical protein